MTLFEWFIIAHLAGDWLFQTEFEAMNKAKGAFFNLALWKHCAVYTLSFVPCFALFGVHYGWLLLVFLSHAFLDRRWPVIWVLRVVKATDEKLIANNFWLVIAVDQVLHILVLAFIAVCTNGVAA